MAVPPGDVSDDDRARDIASLLKNAQCALCPRNEAIGWCGDAADSRHGQLSVAPRQCLDDSVARVQPHPVRRIRHDFRSETDEGVRCTAASGSRRANGRNEEQDVRTALRHDTRMVARTTPRLCTIPRPFGPCHYERDLARRLRAESVDDALSASVVVVAVVVDCGLATRSSNEDAI